MKSQNVLDQLRTARPDSLIASPDTDSPQALALLERILIDESLPRSPSRAKAGRRAAVALVAATMLGAAGLLMNTTAPSATAVVRRAAAGSLNLRTGRASMKVASTFDGRKNDGTVELAWNGDDESYSLNYPDQFGTVEIRLVNGKQYQRNGTKPWQALVDDPTLAAGGANTGRLAAVADGFAALATSIAFDELPPDGKLRHFRAKGDLGTLDTSPAGFVFGTNGAKDASTTALEVWTEKNQLIRKVRVSFVGTPDGHKLTATATTEFHDPGTEVVIEEPS
jgi:hypothetical protein